MLMNDGVRFICICGQEMVGYGSGEDSHNQRLPFIFLRMNVG
jgi:hypothetical protein